MNNTNQTDKMLGCMIEIDLDTFKLMRTAIEDARSWMAHNAAGTDWANRVRQQLNDAIESYEFHTSHIL